MNPAQKQIAFWIAILIVVLFILYQVKGSITDFFTGEGPTSIINEENPLEVDVAKTSYPEHQYEIWADSIYEAFNYTGSNWDAVLAIFAKMNTADDVSALINAYGVRTLYVFAIPTAPLNLPQTLVRESSMSWKGVDDVNELLQSKGINIQF